MGATESILLGADDESGSVREPSSAASDHRPRRRPRPQSATTSSASSSDAGICTLRGVVLGLPKSGKRTLLDRLQGKDPFDPPTRDANASQPQDKTASIAAPYQAPSKTWDPKIQIEASLELSDQAGVDFAVVLVHPHQKRKRLQKHLKQSIHSLLQAQGYEREKLDGVHEEEKEEKTGTTHEELRPNVAGSTRPVCLCILINFRDLLDDNDEDGLSDTISSITSITMDVLQEYPAVEPDRLVLVCGHVSLFNCFGLGLLHSFIYQAYLQRKRCYYERLLQEVHAAKRGVAPVNTLAYVDYIAQMVLSSSQQPNGDGISSKPRSRREVSNEQQMDTVLEVTKQTGSANNGQTRRRQIMVPSQVAAPSKVEPPAADPFLSNSKDALEAFLADSDSEADSGPKTLALQNENGASSDTDDDDDDDAPLYSDAPKDSQSQSPEQLLRKDIDVNGVSHYETTSPSSEVTHRDALSREELQDDKDKPYPNRTETVVSPSETMETTTSDQPQLAKQTAESTNEVIADDEADQTVNDADPGQSVDVEQRLRSAMEADAGDDMPVKSTSNDSASPNPKVSPSSSMPPVAERLVDDDDSSSDGRFIVGGSLSKQVVDSDDEDFVIESVAPSTRTEPHAGNDLHAMSSRKISETRETKEAAPGGLSKEVLAALAAAQREAEEMAKLPEVLERPKKEKKEKKARKKSQPH